jgi:hypothetical protein
MEQKNIERRAFMRSAVLTAAGAVAGAGLLASRAEALDKPLHYHDIPTLGLLNLPDLPAGNDVQVLNYALTLEDLEADCYVQCLQRLTTGGTNKIGTNIPGLGLSDMEPDVAYCRQFAVVEATHRDFLRGALNSLISNLATHPRKYDFGIESKSREEVLALLLTVEATGVAAYLGAVPRLKTKLFITAAAAIQGTEARHTATLTAIQNKLFNGGSPKPIAPLASDNHGIDTPIDPDTVLAQISPFIV